MSRQSLLDNHLFSVSIERRLRVPRPEVWAALSDFGEHGTPKQFIEHSKITCDGTAREGAVREVRLYDGSWMYQRIVDYQPGRSMVLEVVQEEPWLRHHLVEMSVLDEPDQACRLVCRVAFRTPSGLLGVPIGWYYRARLRSLYNLILRGLVRDLRDPSRRMASVPYE